MAVRTEVILLLASCLPAAWAEATKGAFYLQVQTRRGASQPMTESVSWATGPFGECILHCNGPLQLRSVQCRTMQDEPADDQECEGLQRPADTKACDCSMMLCVSKASKSCEEQHTKDSNTLLTSEASEDAHNDISECLGCFPLSDDGLDEGLDAYNDACAYWNSNSPCRSGLPFYSMRSPDLDTSLCQSFCTSKGLDLSGIVGEKECRCGASRLNRAVWMGAEPRPGLLLPKEPMSECRTERSDLCPMRVYRFRGPFFSFGVPPSRLQLSARDISYMDSIVSGGDVLEEGSSDPELTSRSSAAPSLLTWASKPPGFTRHCDGYGSCGATANWRPRVKMAGDWEEVAIVHYFFERFNEIVDQTRKEAFREATAVYHGVTCIRFVEVEQNFTGVALQVGNYDSRTCYATHAGYRAGWFNLGSCMNRNHLGSILHNLGHVLGMLDEQQRPDASNTYHSHGPHLQVLWDNIPTAWGFLFSPQEAAYTGSAHDGKADAFWGYAPYDFESIMHSPATLHGVQVYQTIPATKMRLVGQRQSLSEGDVRQLLDSYRCRQKVPTTTATTTTTTTTVGSTE